MLDDDKIVKTSLENQERSFILTHSEGGGQYNTIQELSFFTRRIVIKCIVAPECAHDYMSRLWSLRPHLQFPCHSGREDMK